MKKLSGVAAALLLMFGGAVSARTGSESVVIPKLSQLEQHFTASKRVSAFFTRAHYLPVQMDDKLSAKVYDRYLDSLDYYQNILLKVRY